MKIMNFFKHSNTITISLITGFLLVNTSCNTEDDGPSTIDTPDDGTYLINIGGWQSWRLASTPSTNLEYNTEGDLSFNSRRAKIAWYTVDRSIFYQSGSSIISTVITNQYERPVLPQEIFPREDNSQIILNEPLFDIAYFPSERGQYNYNTGFANEPAESNWAGVTRAVTNETNFTATNIQYLEFWLLDPFISGEDGRVLDGIINGNAREDSNGGELVFNFGSISEDIAPDNQFAFENGLSEEGSNELNSEWGVIPTDPLSTIFFANTPGARDNQDVGLDGLPNDEEHRILTRNGITGDLGEDPSADDFRYVIDDQYDAVNAQIVQRYKNWNGMDGNSPVSGNGNFMPTSTTLPDKEDLNNDNTVSNLEEFFEYRIQLQPDELREGSGFIVDQIVGQGGATWYSFRINLLDSGTPIGAPTFENIQYIRMYVTGFERPVVLRFAEFRLVGFRED